MAEIKLRDPKLEHYFFHSLLDEASALLNFLLHQWYVIAIAAALVVSCLWVYYPSPPSKIRIASGQTNSTLEVIAKRYQSIFAEAGIEVELVTTRGAIENLELLQRRQVDVALSQGGVAVESGSDVVSLGSIGYQPLWFFHRGLMSDTDNLFEVIQGKRISIGLQGSGTRIVADAVLGILPQQARAQITLLELPAGDSISALQSGRIDGMFLVAGAESGNVQALLATPGVQITNFTMADGLTRKLPYMEVVKAPRGSLGLTPITPSSDVSMVATTTTILVRESLHPAVQHVLLKGASKMDRAESSFFERPGGFPAFVDKYIRRSEIATRYLADGSLVLERHLPLWAASFLTVSWFWLVALVAVIIPLTRMLPSYRKVMFNVILSGLYGRLLRLYKTSNDVGDSQEARALKETFDRLYSEIRQLWVPKGCTTHYGHLLELVEIVARRMAQLETRFPTSPSPQIELERA
jgi:TRAP-type uncharacterized transport system substrate-binding protein